MSFLNNLSGLFESNPAGLLQAAPRAGIPTNTLAGGLLASPVAGALSTPAVPGAAGLLQAAPRTAAPVNPAVPELDWLTRKTQDPWFKLGMGLMKAGGPSSRPHSFGQDLAASVEGLTASQEEEQARQMRKLQYDELMKQYKSNSKNQGNISSAYSELESKYGTVMGPGR